MPNIKIFWEPLNLPWSLAPRLGHSAFKVAPRTPILATAH